MLARPWSGPRTVAQSTPVPQNAKAASDRAKSEVATPPRDAALSFDVPQDSVSSGLDTTLEPTANASTTTWVSVPAEDPFTPRTLIVIVCSPGPRCRNVRGTRTCRSNVPRRRWSIDTEALPCVGPVAVYQVTDFPVNAKVAVAPAERSTSYERPYALGARTCRQV